MTDVRDAPTTRYYHGGIPGLRVGDEVLPPSETGVMSISDLADAPPGLLARAHLVHRRDRVYLTTDLTAASLFAALHPNGTRTRGGDVYRVHPDGDVEPDPDWLGDPGVSVAAASARVTAIVRTGVRRSEAAS